MPPSRLPARQTSRPDCSNCILCKDSAKERIGECRTNAQLKKLSIMCNCVDVTQGGDELMDRALHPLTAYQYGQGEVFNRCDSCKRSNVGICACP